MPKTSSFEAARDKGQFQKQCRAVSHVDDQVSHVDDQDELGPSSKLFSIEKENQIKSEI